jgi:hypothetical protein
MNSVPEKRAVTIDDVDYPFEDLSDVAISQIKNIQFSEEQILQLQNELAISNTARNGYIRALTKELSDKDGN